MSVDPAGPPPPQFVAYPRPQFAYGNADQLQALSDGYFGLNMVFLINVLMAVTLNLGQMAAGVDLAMIVFAGGALALGLTIGFLTYKPNKRIAYGKGWSESSALIASVLMGLNSAFCCGIIGYIVMQSIASSEMSKYGIKGSFMGLKKADVQATIAAMRASQEAPVPPPASTLG